MERSWCAKMSGNPGERAVLRSKKGKALLYELLTRLYKAACSLNGDIGFLIARPTVLGWFVCDMT